MANCGNYIRSIFMASFVRSPFFLLGRGRALSVPHILALLMQITLLNLQALAPLGQGDPVVAIRIARLQEGRNAVLQCHQRRANREQLVNGHRVVVARVQVAPLPHGSVNPTLGHVGLGLLLHVLVVVGQLLTLGQITHYVEEPVTHTSGEVNHLLLGAGLREIMD